VRCATAAHTFTIEKPSRSGCPRFCMTWQSALGQSDSAVALLTVGGRVAWQSALGQSATAVALLTVGGRVTWQSTATQSHAQDLSGDLVLGVREGLGRLGRFLLLLRPVGPRVVLVDAETSTHHLLPTAGGRRSR